MSEAVNFQSGSVRGLALLESAVSIELCRLQLVISGRIFFNENCIVCWNLWAIPIFILIAFSIIIISCSNFNSREWRSWFLQYFLGHILVLFTNPAFFLNPFKNNGKGETKTACKRARQLPTLLCQQCWELLRPVGSGVQTDTTTPNKFRTCSASWEKYNP